MELPDFLKDYADPELRDAIPEVSYAASLVTDEEVAVIVARAGGTRQSTSPPMIALGDKLIEPQRRSRRWAHLTATNRIERARPARLQEAAGLRDPQCRHAVFADSTRSSPKLRYGAARAHNRHMADFCAEDDRG